MRNHGEQFTRLRLPQHEELNVAAKRQIEHLSNRVEKNIDNSASVLHLLRLCTKDFISQHPCAIFLRRCEIIATAAVSKIACLRRASCPRLESLIPGTLRTAPKLALRLSSSKAAHPSPPPIMHDQTAFVTLTPLPTKTAPSTKLKLRMCERTPDHKSPTPGKKPIKTVRSNASWANNFLAEFGEKGPGSRPDFDLRPKSLRKDVNDPGLCDCCKGTGLMRCTFCLGTEYVQADGSVRPCPACNGKVMVTCSVCFGTKSLVELEGNWWEKGVAALFRK